MQCSYWVRWRWRGHPRWRRPKGSQRHVWLEITLTLLFSEWQTPKLEPAWGKQHFLCLCISLFAFLLSATSDEDFLQAPPAPDSLAWQRGRTMRRKGEHVTVLGGAEREIKGITHTHIYTSQIWGHMQTEARIQVYIRTHTSNKQTRW